MDLSYFSGKLEMYLRYKDIKFYRIELSAYEMETFLHSQTGTEQVPQLYDMRVTTPEPKRWLRDTTAIIEYLENDPLLRSQANTAHPSTPFSILPSDPYLQFFHYLFEDFADEFLWRPAMFLRWEPSFDRFIMGYRFYFEFLYSIQPRYSIIPPFLRPFMASFRQWIVSCYGEDCTTTKKKELILQQYLDILDILQEILSCQPFLCGSTPTFIDFGFAGPFFRHFSSDFTPRKIMQLRAPAVYEWIARLWNAKYFKFKNISIDVSSSNTLPENWKLLLPLLKDYLRYYSLNRIAHRQHQQFFSWEYQNELFNVPVVPYRSWCLMKLQQRYHALPVDIRQEIDKVFHENNCWNDFFTGEGEVFENEGHIDPPFVIYPPPAVRRSYHAEKWNYTSIYMRYIYMMTWKWFLRGMLLGGIGILWKYRQLTVNN